MLPLLMLSYSLCAPTYAAPTYAELFIVCPYLRCRCEGRWYLEWLHQVGGGGEGGGHLRICGMSK